MRRVIKPFAVEVRSTTRQSRFETPKAPVWPELADQPAIEWPEALLPPTAPPELVQVAASARSMQPAPPVSVSVEPYRDPRKAPPSVVPTSNVAAPEVPLPKHAGRILPVIEVLPLVEVGSAGGHVTTKAPVARARRTKPVQAAEPVAEIPVIAPSPVVDAEAVAATPALRRSADRVFRDDFKRGERWKARLPGSVHRAKKRTQLP